MEPEERLDPQELPSSAQPVEGIDETQSLASESLLTESSVEAGEQSVTETTGEVIQAGEDEEAAVEEVAESLAEEAQPVTTEEVKPVAASLGTAPRQLVGEPHPKKKFWAKVLPWVIVAALFYVGGLATIFFALYQPYKQANDAAAAELSASSNAQAESDADRIIDLTNDYNQALKQYSDAQAELDLTKAELQAANITITDKDAELASASKINLAYKFLVDVSSARIALEKQDTATVRQALNFAKADLEELKKTDLTADVISGFAEKLNEASSNLTPSGMEKTRTALETLYTNLLQLINNIP